MSFDIRLTPYTEVDRGAVDAAVLQLHIKPPAVTIHSMNISGGNFPLRHASLPSGLCASCGTHSLQREPWGESRKDRDHTWHFQFCKSRVPCCSLTGIVGVEIQKSEDGLPLLILKRARQRAETPSHRSHLDSRSTARARGGGFARRDRGFVYHRKNLAGMYRKRC